MKAVSNITLILIIIGGINWGLVGAFDYNLVDAIFGEGSFLARAVYVLVGLAALLAIPQLFKGDVATSKRSF